VTVFIILFHDIIEGCQEGGAPAEIGMCGSHWERVGQILSEHSSYYMIHTKVIVSHPETLGISHTARLVQRRVWPVLPEGQGPVRQ
jgi:hypothetical protein